MALRRDGRASHLWRLAPLAALAASGLVWLLPAAVSMGRIAGLAATQLGGPAVGTDFLNLYAGTWLFSHTPTETYALDSQLALQQQLTGWASPIVPFYVPPYAALGLAWLAWLPYGAAWLLWLLLGLACLALATRLLAPPGWRWWLAGMAGSLLFLPVLLALKQGQTSLPMLLGAAWLSRELLREAGRSRAWRGVLGLLTWAIKPQLLPAWLLALLVARRWRPLLASGVVLALLTGVALLVLGPNGLASYSAISHQKWQEALFADGLLLPGPTLLQGSYVLLGVNGLARAVAGVGEVVVVLAMVWAWRDGPRRDQRRLLQVALLPLAGVLLAPYALLHEASLWLAPFWLVWRYTAHRPGQRAGLVWFAVLFGSVANVGVLLPDSAWPAGTSLLGVLAVGLLVWETRRESATEQPREQQERQGRGGQRGQSGDNAHPQVLDHADPHPALA